MSIRYARVMMVLGILLALAGCNKAPKDDMKMPKDDMQAQLDKIRALVIQSSLFSVEAACADPEARTQLVDGALALLRRATVGPF